MKSSSSTTKPLSSPGRTEKFPPPLMRFLRTNTSSKSHRARSRSSPMFIVRKRNSIEASNTSTAKIPEPSSPKVTCMGQVRVKRANNPKKQRIRNRNPKKASSLFSCRCQWLVPMIPRALFSRPKLSRPILGKWASFLQLSFRRKVGAKEESNNGIESAVENPDRRFTSDESEKDEEEEESFATNNRASMATLVASPPKNALILTRCRSAPYRSSSLARRFWESPLKNNEEEEEKKQSTETENRESEKEEENESKNEESKSESEKKEELGLGLGLSVLSRCKSEPARTGEKLGIGPENGFMKNDNEDYREKRRFGFFVNSRSPIL